MVEVWLLFTLVAIAVAVKTRVRSPLGFVPLVVAALVLDYRGNISASGGSRYAILFGLAVCLLRLAGRRAHLWGWPELLTVVLVGSAVVGVAYNRLISGQVVSTVLPIVVPLILLLLPSPARFTSPSVSETRVLALSGLVLASGMAYARTEGAGRAPLTAFNHEKMYLVVFAVLVAVTMGHRIIAALTLLVLTMSFLAYPAATVALGVVIGLGTFVAVMRVRSRLGCMRFAYLVGASLVGGLVSLSAILGAFSGYFSLVGKTDNGATRAELYFEALSKISESPAWGSLFTGSVTAQVLLNGTMREVPFHNDYLTLAVGGGVLAPAFLILIVVLANFRAAQFVSSTIEKRDRRFIACAVASVNVAAFSALVNPVLSNVLAAMGFSVILVGVFAASKSVRYQPASSGSAEVGSTPCHTTVGKRL